MSTGKKPPRLPARAVELEDIISTGILGDNPEVLALVLRIHLALEAILIDTLKTFREANDTLYRLSFPEKTKALFKQGLISEELRDAFDRVNDFRNDFAHVFGHRVTVAEVLRLARDLEEFGIDFSDSAGHYSEADAMQYYGGLLGILSEVGWCILYEAAFILMENGGRDIFSARN